MAPDRQAHPIRALAVLGYATLSYSLAQTAIVPALPRLITGLHTNANDVAWTLSGYFLSAAVCTLIMGRLGDMFGKRRLSVIAMAGFSVGALVAALSSDLIVVVIGRVAAGVGGAIFVLSFGITRDLFPPTLRARASA
jgi:MFS family permease